jgi:hypothetical protein
MSGKLLAPNAEEESKEWESLNEGPIIENGRGRALDMTERLNFGSFPVELGGPDAFQANECAWYITQRAQEWDHGAPSGSSVSSPIDNR